MSKVPIILSILLATVSTAGAVTYWKYSSVKSELSETQKNTVKRSDFVRLSDQLSLVTAERSDARRAISKMKGEIESLRDYPEKLASLEKRTAGLEKSLKQKDELLKRKDQSLAKQKRDHQREMTGLQETLNQRDTLLKRKDQSMGRLKNDHEMALAGLQESLRKTDLQLERKNKTIGKLKNEHEKKLAALSDEIDVLRNGNAAAQKTVQTLERKLVQMEREIDILEKDRQTLAALESQLARLRKEHQRKEDSIKRLKTTYDDLLLDLKKEIEKKEVTVSQFEERLKISLVNRVLFAGGSCEISPGGQKILKQVAQILKNVNDKFIFVVGHTDDLPIGENLIETFPSNWELSAARAAAVVRFLTRKGGIRPEVFVTAGRSYYQPAKSNETPEGKAQNRRAEIIVGNSLDLEQGNEIFSQKISQ